MSKPGRRVLSGQGALSEDEKELWAAVAQTVEPVRSKARIHHGALEAAKSSSPRQTEVKWGGVRPGDVAHPPANPRPVASPLPVKPSPLLAVYDRRRVRKLAAGRIEIEARLDLHGLRLREAHAALRSFLLECHANGLRNVMVITGKGSAAEEDVSSQRDILDRRDRGVLKRNVPRWLAEPGLRAVVVGYTTAHPRHGGEGALYIQVRSRERIKDRG